MDTLYLLLAMFSGIAIRFLFKKDSAKRSNKRFDLPLALSTALLSIIGIGTLIFVRESISDVLPFNNFLAVVYGYSGDSLIRAFMKKFKPNLK